MSRTPRPAGNQSPRPGDGASTPVERRSSGAAPINLRSSAALSGAEKGSATDSNVRVCVRVRPFNQRERDENEDDKLYPIVNLVDDTAILSNRVGHNEYVDKDTSFGFDNAFWSVDGENPATQESVYEEIGAPLVGACAAGFNISVMAYGQTGSGKTHTMLGSAADPGLAPRTVRSLFEMLQSMSEAIPAHSFSVELSFMEIYNEHVRDLLVNAHETSGNFSAEEATKQYQARRVRNHPQYGPYVEDLIRVPIHNADECIDLIAAGVENRATASTSMNATSSRSHAIFQLAIKQRDAVRGTQKISIANLVDLAGSERVKLSKVQGKNFTEATKINLSLSTLRRVIDILLENSHNKKNQQRPPYRDSMLTWLLSDTLGGNSKTVMIATVSPFYKNFEDTQNTLIYAVKAKSIICHVRVNEEKSEVVVKAIKEEMENLQRRLTIQQDEAEDEATLSMRSDLADREKELKKMMIEQQIATVKRTQYENSIKLHESRLNAIEEDLAPKLEILAEERALHNEIEDSLKNVDAKQRQLNEEVQVREKRSTQITMEMQRRNALFIKREMKLRLAASAKQIEKEAYQIQMGNLFKSATELKKFRDQIKKLKQENADLKAEEEELEHRSEELIKKFAKSEKDCRAEGRVAGDLEVQADKLSQEVGDTLEDMTDRVKTLQRGRKEAQTTKTEVEEETVSVNKSIDELNGQMELSVSVHDKCSEDEAALNAKLAERDELRAVVGADEEQYTSNENRTRQLTQDIEDQKDALCVAKFMSGAVIDEESSLAPTVEDLEKEITALMTELNTTNSELASVVDGIHSMTRACEDTQRDTERARMFCASKLSPKLAGEDIESANSPVKVVHRAHFAGARLKRRM